MKSRIPLIVTVLFTLMVGMKLMPPKNKADAFPTLEFGKLPIIQSGRTQPMDSLARNSLLQLRGKQTLNTEPWKGTFDKPKIISAVDWMLEVMMDPATADTRLLNRLSNALVTILQSPEYQLC